MGKKANAITSHPPPSTELAGLDGLIGFNLGLAYSYVLADLEPKLFPLRLTAKLAAILWIVDINPGMTQSSLGKIFRLKRSTINMKTKRLIHAGYLVVNEHPDDNRKLGLTLTASGRHIVEEAKLIVERHEKQLRAKIEQGHDTNLIAMLRDLVS